MRRNKIEPNSKAGAGLCQPQLYRPISESECWVLDSAEVQRTKIWGERGWVSSVGQIAVLKRYEPTSSNRGRSIVQGPPHTTHEEGAL